MRTLLFIRAKLYHLWTSSDAPLFRKPAPDFGPTSAPMRAQFDLGLWLLASGDRTTRRTGRHGAHRDCWFK